MLVRTPVVRLAYDDVGEENPTEAEEHAAPHHKSSSGPGSKLWGYRSSVSASGENRSNSFLDRIFAVYHVLIVDKAVDKNSAGPGR